MKKASAVAIGHGGMRKAIFHNIRDNYEESTTLGEMMDPNAKHFGFTLEDIVRPYGIKDKKWTAIPATKGDDLYFLDLHYSEKYKDVVVVYTRKEKKSWGWLYILEYGGISFEMIYVHGGNDHSNTEGCILCAKNRNNTNRTIQGSLKKEFYAEVKKWKEDGYQTMLRVTNKPQAQ